jgi:hypothetical protein
MKNLVRSHCRPWFIIAASTILGITSGAAIVLWSILRYPLAKTEPGLDCQFLTYLAINAAGWGLMGGIGGLILGTIAASLVGPKPR